ncbi:MAG: type VI secretion system tip protein TssI/VgrG [Polyangiales bacterium]
MAYNEGPTGDQVLPEVAFAFEVAGADGAFTVSRAVVRERLCAPFEGSVEVAVPSDVDPPTLLGRPCALTLRRDVLSRTFAGVVTSVEDRGVDREGRVFEVAFSPSLSLLGLSARYRVWQRVDALRIVRDVLDAAGLYTGDCYDASEATTTDAPAPREYCVQYGESDLDFVRRLLAEEGALFCFDARGDDETLEVFDARSASRRPAVPTVRGAAIHVVASGQGTASAESIRRLDVASSVTTSHVSLRDYDFTHPQTPLTSAEPQPARSVERYPARFVLGAYDEGAHRYGTTDLRRAARVELQQHTAEAAVVRGESDVTGMRAGATFSVTERGERALEGRFLITAVLHVGHAPDVGLSDHRGASAEDRYSNRFECVDVRRAWAAPPPPRPRADHPQVAVVTAEPGSDEEICTDAHGRVRVRFPWDRVEQRRGAQSGTSSSCWLRVMQPWSGAHWGFHFTPRVGMEVVVHFVDGDPDRPYVAGCLPNAVNVPPVVVPLHKTQSAIRTHSSPGGNGYNELRFEDLAHHEEVYLRAQRDQRVEVLHDRALSVGRDESAQVGRDESLHVGRNRSIDVEGDEQHTVTGARQISVGGDELREVSGNHSLIVHKSVTLHADETGRVTTNDGLVIEVGGGSGTATEMSPDEIAVRAPKKHTVAVGDDVVEELSTERFAVKAPKGLALVCGDTRVEIAEDRIVLQTKSGAKVELDGDKITIKTSGPVSIKGSQVTNN